VAFGKIFWSVKLDVDLSPPKSELLELLELSFEFELLAEICPEFKF
jgi:hypothetical protein